MNLMRKLLFPFAILYGFVSLLRNYLYDTNVFKSKRYAIPIIAVGNLNVGGTGKTPQIEYLIRLLSSHYKVATLSRGYKRKSDGFILADKLTNAEVLGDEPFQFYKKFPTIQVAVDEDRRNGIEKLLAQPKKPDVILLDDAFQHRKVKAGFYILLTAYDDLFCADYILPVGNLRESRNGAKRADMIIVTKCPSTISEAEQNKIKKAIGIDLPIYFSFIEYEDHVYNNKNESILTTDLKSFPKIVLAGIANPKPFFTYLNAQPSEILTFSDHHNFNDTDIQNIKDKSKNKYIITTEKDFVRLEPKILNSQLFYLPIKSAFFNDQDTFDAIILNYVGTTRKHS